MYPENVHLASSQESEVLITLEVMIELANAAEAGMPDVRSMLDEAGFPRARKASEASIQRLGDRLTELRMLVLSLPDLSVAEASAQINEELTELDIAPAVMDHDGVGPHLHWTPATATFDSQVIADFLMATAQELCTNGTIRFGRCGADDCERIFYDRTRNRSRRFCDDQRCASRTHTAQHRARVKGA